KEGLETENPDKIVHKINVVETIYGKAESKTIELYQSEMLVGYEPALKKGEKLVFILHKQQTTNGYVSVHPYASYYYIDQQNYIHPVYDTKDFENYANMLLKNFKKVIHNTFP